MVTDWLQCKAIVILELEKSNLNTDEKKTYGVGSSRVGESMFPAQSE